MNDDTGLGACARCGGDVAPTNGISIQTSDGRKYCQKCTMDWLKESAAQGDTLAAELLSIMEGQE